MSFKYSLKRSERIKMFLSEYYFGQTNIITILRFIGGPILIFLGIEFYQRNDKFAVAYGGSMFLYGIYYIFKPLTWILFRLDSFKTVNLNIEVLDDRIIIKDPISESEILLEGIDKILPRKYYFALQLSKYNKVYLPFTMLSQEQFDILNQFSTKKTI